MAKQTVVTSPMLPVPVPMEALPEWARYVEPQLTHAQYEIERAARHGVSLDFIREAWETELAMFYFQLFPHDGLTLSEQVNTFMEAVHPPKSPKGRYARRLNHHHGRHVTSKPRHGVRRGVRTGRRGR